MIKKSIPTNLKAARRVVEELLDRTYVMGYGEDVRFAIRLAFEEALINAIKHGNRFDRGKKIRILADVGTDRVRITVSDEGVGFDPDGLPDPTADENLEKPCGRGVMLMRAYMDEVAYNDRGNEVCMTKGRWSGLPRLGGEGPGRSSRRRL